MGGEWGGRREDTRARTGTSACSQPLTPRPRAGRADPGLPEGCCLRSGVRRKATGLPGHLKAPHPATARELYTRDSPRAPRAAASRAHLGAPGQKPGLVVPGALLSQPCSAEWASMEAGYLCQGSTTHPLRNQPLPDIALSPQSLLGPPGQEPFPSSPQGPQWSPWEPQLLDHSSRFQMHLQILVHAPPSGTEGWLVLGASLKLRRGVLTHRGC